MQVQCEQHHQGKDRISLITHAAAYASFNMHCKIDTEWKTDDFLLPILSTGKKKNLKILHIFMQITVLQR